MTAGRLNKRITLRRAAYQDDGFSSEGVETWSDLATVWTEAKPVRDSEKLAAGQTLATIAYRFLIRISSTVKDLGPKDRLLFSGREFDIHAVKPAGSRDEYLEISASAEVS